MTNEKFNMITVYDNGGKTIDRYTIIIRRNQGYDVYGMSSNPFSSQGFNQFSFTIMRKSELNRGELGHTVNFITLPDEVKSAILDRLHDIE
jgi:hypothetical protein